MWLLTSKINALNKRSPRTIQACALISDLPSNKSTILTISYIIISEQRLLSYQYWIVMCPVFFKHHGFSLIFGLYMYTNVCYSWIRIFCSMFSEVLSAGNVDFADGGTDIFAQSPGFLRTTSCIREQGCGYGGILPASGTREIKRIRMLPNFGRIEFFIPFLCQREVTYTFHHDLNMVNNFMDIQT